MKKKAVAKILSMFLAASMIFSMSGVSALAKDAVSQDVVEAAAEGDPAVKFPSGYAAVNVPLEVSVTGLTDPLTYSWEVGNKKVSSTASYIPKESDLEKFIKVTVSDSQKSVSGQIYFSRLPVVYIDTGNTEIDHNNYIDASLIIQGNEKYKGTDGILYNGATEIKGRGNSTWGRAKKPYKLKLDKKEDLFGFGKNKHWVLLANDLDTTFLRNKLAYDLSGEMGVPQMQSVLTDVVLDGKYIGNYQLCEHIRVDDGNRVDIFDWESAAEDAAEAISDAIIEERGLTAKSDEGKAIADALETQMKEGSFDWVTSDKVSYGGKTYTVSDYYAGYSGLQDQLDGGYLLEMDSYFDERSKFKTASGQPMMFNKPEYASTNTTMYDYVKEYIQAFEDAVNADDFNVGYNGAIRHYTDLFDMQSLVDNWIVQEIFFNTDFMKKSTYMYKAHGEPFKMGPVWDMDWSSGNSEGTGNQNLQRTDQWQTLFFKDTNNDAAQDQQWYKQIVKDPYFLRMAQSRYWEIRDTAIKAMFESIDTLSGQIKESAEADFKAWNRGGSYSSSLATFKQWMTARLNWLDQKMASYDTLRNEFIKNEQTSIKMTVSDADGKALASDTESPAQAAFDGMVEPDNSVKIALSGLSNMSKVEIRVNGRKVGEAEVTGDTLEYQLPNLGEDSVIQAYVYKAGDEFTGMAYKAVKVKTVDELVLETEPTTQQYAQGDSLDTKGLVVKATYGGKTEAVPVEKLSIDKTVLEGSGEQKVTATYGNKSVSFTVTVAADGQQTEPQEGDYAEIPNTVLAQHARANSYQDPPEGETDGPASYAFNGDLSNWWHSRWRGDPDTSKGEVEKGEVSDGNPIWIETGFGEEKDIYSITYQGRTGEASENNLIQDYEVQVACLADPSKTPEDKDFVTAKTGTLAGTSGEKEIVLDEPVRATHIRLVAISVSTKTGTKHVAASQIKVYALTDKSTIPALTELSVSAPQTVAYGVALAAAGMKATAKYSNSQSKDVTADVTISGYNAKTPGQQTVTVSYHGKAAQITVTVQESTGPTEPETSEKISFTKEYPVLGEPLGVEVSGMTAPLKYRWETASQTTNGETYTPVQKDLQDFITVTVTDAAGESASKRIFFSKLPVIYIDTDNGEKLEIKGVKVNADMVMQGNEKYNSTTPDMELYSGRLEISVRGNSTAVLPKKPYKLKLDKKADIFGFGKSKSWVLLANYLDTTFMRNKLAYDLSGKLGVPYMQSVLTDVVLNGEYTGNYQFCEQVKIDKNRIDIENWEDHAEDAADAIAEAEAFSEEDTKALEDQMVEDLSWATSGTVSYKGKEYKVADHYDKTPGIDGGYLLELDSAMDEVSNFFTRENQPIMVKEPEYANTNQEMMDYLQTYIQAFEDAASAEDYTALYKGESKHYTELFDMGSLVDNWLVQEIFFNVDFMKKSSYMYKEHGELFKMGPIWDMDWTSGNTQTENWDLQWTDQWQTLFFPSQYGDGPMQADQWYKSIVNDPYFLHRAYERYWEVRGTYIQEMLDSIGEIKAEISESAEASLSRWYLEQGDQSGRTPYEVAMERFETWMEERIAWLDAQMKDYPTLEASISKYKGDSAKATAVYADGTALEKDTKGRSDGIVESGRSLKAQLSGARAEVTKAIVWANAEKIKEVEVKNGSAEAEIPSLKEDTVILWYLYAANGDLVGKASMSVNRKGVPLQEVKLNYTEAELNVWDEDTQTVKLQATYSPEDTTDDTTVTWSVSGQATGEGGTYDIVKVDEDGTVHALWPGKATVTAKVGDKEASCTVTVKGVETKYSDMPDDAAMGDPRCWYYEHINWVYINGRIMEGYKGSDAFGVAKTLKRAEFAMMVWHLAGNPETLYEQKFPDVNANDYFAEAVTWASSQGIVNGYEDGRFGPNDDLTRAQMVTMLCRYLGADPKTADEKVLDPFPDKNDVQLYAKETMPWAVSEGLIQGKNGELKPQQGTQREEAAAIIMRFKLKFENTNVDPS